MEKSDFKQIDKHQVLILKLALHKLKIEKGLLN